MALRLGEDRLVMLDAPALTGARRHEGLALYWRPLVAVLCLALYLLGVPPRWIARLEGA